MRVRYISGNQKGRIEDVGPEAAMLLSNRIVERVADDEPAVEPPAELPGDSTPEPDLETELVDAPKAAPKKKPRAARAPRLAAKKKR